MGKWQSIGHDVDITMLTDHLDRFVGLLERHMCKGDPDSPGVVTILFDLPWNNKPENAARPRWSVEHWEPLTIHPSVLCRRCGLHGWIRAGSWVPDGDLIKQTPETVDVPITLTIGDDAQVLETLHLVKADDPDAKRLIASILRNYADKIDDGSWLSRS